MDKMKKLDEFFQGVGLEWKGSGDETQQKGFENSHIAELYTRYAPDIDDPLERLRVTMRIAGVFKVKDWQRFFKAIGQEEKGKKFPTEVLQEVYFTYQGKRTNPDFDWVIVEENTPEKKAYFKRKKRESKLKSLFDDTPPAKTANAEITREMIDWMKFFFEVDLKGIFEERLILPLKAGIDDQLREKEMNE